MKSKIFHGPLIRFCLFPLIFTMDIAYQGIVTGIGVLILYPFLSIIVEILKKKIRMTDAFYIVSFIGVLSGSLYILSIGMIDWKLYRQLSLTFPVSMTASAILIGLLENHDEHVESAPFVEAVILAVLILMFTCVRDIILHGSLDFRFGKLGSLYVFENLKKFFMSNSDLFSTVNLKGGMFFFIAFLIAVMGINKKDNMES